ncbi:chondroitin AC/alginate lyase [Mycena leptocephala]|nr:chondroitin AC/alginate lyase [Mycena leptocephala]
MSTPVEMLTTRASFEADATAAYQNALVYIIAIPIPCELSSSSSTVSKMWKLTGVEEGVDGHSDERANRHFHTGIKLHATKAIQIMDAWSGTLKSVDPNYIDMQLASSLGPFAMTNAAEIIRYTSAGWTASGISSLSSMLNNVFYPRLNNHTGVQYEANVGTGNTKALMGFAVFTENTTMYSEAISLYSNERCSGLALDIPSTQSLGEIRDTLSLGNLAESCQVAWIQGTNDLFALLSNRLLTGYEYTAKYNLRNTVPYDATFQRCNSSIVGGPFAAISNTTRGTFRPIYELAYAHYVSTKGLSMPFTLQIGRY